MYPISIYLCLCLPFCCFYYIHWLRVEYTVIQISILLCLRCVVAKIISNAVLLPTNKIWSTYLLINVLKKYKVSTMNKSCRRIFRGHLLLWCSGRIAGIAFNTFRKHWKEMYLELKSNILNFKLRNKEHRSEDDYMPEDMHLDKHYRPGIKNLCLWT